jgi:CheY-like chemotaxis protein
MDIRLPKMDGFQVTKKLRENPEFSDTPIIALTAHAMAGDRESVIKSGCNAYLSKPIDTHELLEMIAETLLKRKHQSNDGEK